VQLRYANSKPQQPDLDSGPGFFLTGKVMAIIVLRLYKRMAFPLETNHNSTVKIKTDDGVYLSG
jgi:hypothetical protein